MQFKQKVTWMKVAKILATFLVVTLVIMALVTSDIMQGKSLALGIIALIAYLGVSLGVIATELKDFDQYPYSPVNEELPGSNCEPGHEHLKSGWW